MASRILPITLTMNLQREWHDDANDRDLAIKYILPKIILGHVQSFAITDDEMFPYDILTLSRERFLQAIPVQVKNRLKYKLYQFKNEEVNKYTTVIDETAYIDFQNDGIIIILYPADKKVLVYNCQQMRDAYVGKKITDVPSYNRKTKTFYVERNKSLAELDIAKGIVYTYEQLGIPA